MTLTATAPRQDDLAAFRTQARRLLAANAKPSSVLWTNEPGQSLFNHAADEQEHTPNISRGFMVLAEAAACHRDPARWPLLYEALWRLVHEDRTLLAREADPLVHRLRRMEAAVRRDTHRMTAFVRFRPIQDSQDSQDEHYVACYEPEHFTLRRASRFFTDRFATLRFSILTPDLTLHWDRTTLHFAPGVSTTAAAGPDAMEAWWKHYYAATFNPDRNNPALMARHMPRRFWRNLPEAGTATSLSAEAAERTAEMLLNRTRLPRPLD